MISRLLEWYLSQPKSDRVGILAWLASFVLLGVIGFVAYRQLPGGMSPYYYLVILFVLDSAVFFSLQRQLPTIRVTMLTLIIVLELATLGYYLLARSVILL